MPKHAVRFEPVDIEMEAYEEETVLDAAFRQGVSRFHRRSEGQRSACKQFLLEGDLEWTCIALARSTTGANQRSD